MCNMEVETKEHLFRDCKITKRVWASLNLGMRMEKQQQILLKVDIK